LSDVSQAGLTVAYAVVSGVRNHVILEYVRDDGPRDQIPMIADRCWDDGLKIEIVTLTIFVWTEIVIVVELKRHTDEIGNGVGELFGQIFIRLRDRGRGRDPQRDPYRDKQDQPHPVGRFRVVATFPTDQPEDWPHVHGNSLIGNLAGVNRRPHDTITRAESAMAPCVSRSRAL
jgi:hypothetical protein